MVHNSDIAALLYLKSDAYIARYLGVSEGRVAAVRANPEAGKDKRLEGRPLIRVQEASPQMSNASQRDFERMVVQGSDGLLRKQLETGQCHWDRAFARSILKQRGWV